VSASAGILIDSADPKSRLDFKVTLRDASGQPLAGKDIVLRIEGDGSLQPGHDAKQIVRETNARGEVTFSWFRRSIFGRDVKAEVSAEPRDLPDAEVILESTEIQTATTSYRTKTWPLKVGGRNIWR
jgi:hypothetical protein